MRRKVSTIVIIAALLILLVAATALAIGIRRSAEADIVVQARQALMADYGLTNETIGCFTWVMTQDGDAWTVSFVGAAWELSRLGSYTVRIAPGQAAQTEWSHDDVDPAVWRDGDMNAPAWGQPQIHKRLQMSQAEWNAYSQEHMRPLDAVEDIPATFPLLLETVDSYQEFIPLTPDSQDIGEEQALRAAIKALCDAYAIDAETLSGSEQKITLAIPSDGGYRQYIVEFKLAKRGQGAMVALVGSPSGDILSLWWRVDREMRTLPEGSLEKHEHAAREFLSAGAFVVRDGAEKMGIARRLIEEGLGHLVVTVPAESFPAEQRLSKEDITAGCNRLLMQAYGLEEEALALFDVVVKEVGEEGGGYVADYLPMVPKAQWGWNWSTFVTRGIGTYTVLVKPDLVVAEVVWSHAGVWEDRMYTGNTWGSAPAYHASLLPRALALLADINAIASQYAEDTTIYDYAFEDYAQFDTAFREAGFSPVQFSRAMPAAGDLSYEVAFLKAKEALLAEMPTAEDSLSAADVSGAYTVEDADAPVWRFSFFFMHDEIAVAFGVALDAKTGEILFTNVIAGGNG